MVFGARDICSSEFRVREDLDGTQTPMFMHGKCILRLGSKEINKTNKNNIK